MTEKRYSLNPLIKIIGSPQAGTLAMDYRHKIISSLADKECKWICQKVICYFQKVTEGMQSGDDSPLENLWDEVCVQVQFDQSIFWGFYLEYLQAIISQEVKKLDAPTAQAIWLQTYEGDKFQICRDEDDDPSEALKCLWSDDDITDYILNNYVLSQAAITANETVISLSSETHKYSEYEPMTVKSQT